MSSRVRVELSGAVQGVGFRPFVYGLATRLGLRGFVVNTAKGLRIELEGDEQEIAEFMTELSVRRPPLAVVADTRVQALAVSGTERFEIRASVPGAGRTVLVSPDYATCAECLLELLDPNDRRFRYPFINCTNCGPRYTIVKDVPYDRSRTTMADFELCAACRAEYEDPVNRRFHAEPTCCPVCGPKVWLTDSSGRRLEQHDPVEACLTLLAEGKILAVKGVGGFHLACDAASEQAVTTLRQRKRRAEKPFAVMVRDEQTARAVAALEPHAEAVLAGVERPIVLLRKKPGHGLADAVAPKSPDFGVMLPYTPLHHLLMAGPCRALVMTSGNVTDEPIAHENPDALGRLAGVADAFLLHDRDIHIRADDSVVRIVAGAPAFLRRSRGYAPFPVRLPFNTADAEVLAVGPELKNTVCVTREGYAFASHHVGDLENAAAYRAFCQAADHLCNILDVAPAYLACDMHPGYLSTRYARHRGEEVIPVQHHHAHAASVLAEHGRTGRVIGVTFDGLGWGENGEVWGGEFLTCDLDAFQRAGHIELMPQPGGDAAAKRPGRMAYVYLRQILGADEAEERAAEFLPSLDGPERQLIERMIARDINCPMTSSVGRLFDAASALLDVCRVNTYEGQAAVELEGLAAPFAGDKGHYAARIEGRESGPWTARTSDIIGGLLEDVAAGVERGVCAARFHNAVAHMAAAMCGRIRESTGLGTVAVSGGVFANALLAARLKSLLERDGFEVLLNRVAPAGDGGISLGQAAVAAWRVSCA